MEDKLEGTENPMDAKREGSKQKGFRGNFSPATTSADTPTAGPSGVHLRLKSLVDELKAMRALKAQYAKNRAKLSPEKRKRLADKKEKKEVCNFMLPDSPKKNRKKGDSRNWIPCPLLPGVPAVPPARKPQPWEVQRSHESIEVSDKAVLQGTPPKVTENRPLLNKRKRKVNFAPSTQFNKPEDPPVNSVLVGGTPPKVTENRPLLNLLRQKANFVPSSQFNEPEDPPVAFVLAEGSTPPKETEIRPLLNEETQKDHFAPSSQFNEPEDPPVIFVLAEGSTPPKETEIKPLLNEETQKDHFTPSSKFNKPEDPPVAFVLAEGSTPPKETEIRPLLNEETQKDHFAPSSQFNEPEDPPVIFVLAEGSTPPKETEIKPLLNEGTQKDQFAPSSQFNEPEDPPVIFVLAEGSTPPKETENKPLLNEGKKKVYFAPSSQLNKPEDPPVNSVLVGGTPPKVTENRHLLNKRKRKVNFAPSSQFKQPEDSPVSSVLADIGGVNSKPGSSASGTGLGTSTVSFTIDADFEGELSEPDSGSDIEVDVEPGNRGLNCPAAEVEDDLILAEHMREIGAVADFALRAMADPDDSDLLCFDWRGDIKHFEGVRETFTGPSGPTFELTELTALEVFKKIWDDDIIARIVRETNRYAHQLQDKTASKTNSRLSRWRDTTVEEIWRFFSVIMLQSLVVNNVEREYWYPCSDQLRIGNFDLIMNYNRFLLVKRCLHFVDNTVLRKKPSKLDKVKPIIDHLNDKFSTLYLPEQNVAIDESLLLWKGRLSFAQMIANKRAKAGIKSYELCESRTGYLWRMEVYSGKGEARAQRAAPRVGHEAANEPESATSRIVYNLMRPLFGKGHTVVMDSFYNAPLLSRLLKVKHKTDTMGTLRLNREFVPDTLKHKDKRNMRSGEVCFSTTKDLSLVVWRDNSVVALISTFHRPEVGGKEKYGYYKYKPKVVLDYNLSMGGVDHKDQMLHAFPIERVRNMCWYKKLFRRLVNVSVHNALVMYNHHRTGKNKIGNREFRAQLVREMMQRYSPGALGPRRPPPPPQPSPPPVALAQMHLPAKNQKPQRCKMCHEANVRRSTVWRCGTCKVNLCIEKCYPAYHANMVPPSDSL